MSKNTQKNKKNNINEKDNSKVYEKNGKQLNEKKHKEPNRVIVDIKDKKFDKNFADKVKASRILDLKEQKASSEKISAKKDSKFNNKIEKIFKNKVLQIGVVAFIFMFVSIFGLILGNKFTNFGTIQANANQTRIAQAKLYELGYFKNNIDGVYDQETISAVSKFQFDKGITESGVIDKATATALGVSTSEQTNTDIYLLAKLIYAESRGEPYTGQVAVGAVVLNRVDDPGFPNTLQGVIYQPWAFTCTHDGQFGLEPNSTAYEAAQDAMNGWDPSYGCLYYYNPAVATSQWIFSRQTVVTIGNHVFAL